MPSLPIFHVDAFADGPFTGNPAAVCPLKAPLPDALMQNIAAQNNLSETAFFHAQVDAQVDTEFGLRWFTPTVEVDLCGHATLASAFVLIGTLEPSRTEVRFATRSGALVVTRRGDLYQLDLPSYPPAPVGDVETPNLDDGARAVVVALGATPVGLMRARSWLAVFSHARQIRALAPDMSALARLGTAVCATAPAETGMQGVDFVCRYFAPSHGVPEDPVTGSAYCMLAPYWAARLGKLQLRARQLSRRGGEVLCEPRGDRVIIAGRARMVMTGTFQY